MRNARDGREVRSGWNFRSSPPTKCLATTREFPGMRGAAKYLTTALANYYQLFAVS